MGEVIRKMYDGTLKYTNDDETVFFPVKDGKPDYEKVIRHIRGGVDSVEREVRGPDWGVWI